MLPQAGYEWPRLIADAEALQARPTKARRSAREKLHALGWLAAKAPRVWIALALLLLLLVVRQVYVGGRIPLVREPERFRVDVDPAGEAGERPR